MEFLTPFAYSPVGEVLVATDERWVCVSGDADDSTLWSFKAAARVVGVRNTRAGILVVDANGLLTVLERESGNLLGQNDCGVQASALAATRDGVWAVLHSDGVCIGQGVELRQRLDFQRLISVALDETGNQLGLGTESGDVLMLNLNTGKRRTLGLKTPITGLAWSRLGWWFICTPHKLHRAELDLSGHRALIVSDQQAGGCVASPDGGLCAFRSGQNRVIVVGPEGKQLGGVRYPERVVGELEFGPFPWLGIGIGQGDGNRVSLLEDNLIYRTDAPPGRPRHSWMIGSTFDGKRVLAERAKLREQGLLPPEEVELLDVQAADDDDDDDDEEGEEIPTLEAVPSEGEEPLAVLPADAPVSAPRAPQRRERATEPEPGTPFVLEPGERILMRGGFGGVTGWAWTVGMGLFWLLLVVFVGRFIWISLSNGNIFSPLCSLLILVFWLFVTAWPFLRSGRYWLTNRRLHWKPRLRAATAARFTAVDTDDIRVSALTSSLHVRAGRWLSLRYISSLERLWGGVVLFSSLDELETAAEGERTEDVACWTAHSMAGVTMQKGTAVLRPAYFAFLPSEGKVNLVGALAGAFANELSGSVLGVKSVSVRAKMPVDLLVEILCERNAPSFDKYIFQAVKQLGGHFWEPGEVTPVKEAFPLQPSRFVLIFKAAEGAIRGAPAREQYPFIDLVLLKWSDGKPLPIQQPVASLTIVSLMLTVPAVLLTWGGYSMTGDPAHQSWEGPLAYSFAGVVGLPALLCWLLMLRALILGRQARPKYGESLATTGRPRLR